MQTKTMIALRAVGNWIRFLESPSPGWCDLRSAQQMNEKPVHVQQQFEFGYTRG